MLSLCLLLARMVSDDVYVGLWLHLLCQGVEFHHIMSSLPWRFLIGFLSKMYMAEGFKKFIVHFIDIKSE